MDEIKVKGVFFDNNSGKYRCFIHVNNKKIWLGYYADRDEAVRVRHEAQKYYKEDYVNREWGILHFYKNFHNIHFDIDDNINRLGLIIMAIRYLNMNENGQMFSTYAIDNIKTLTLSGDKNWVKKPIIFNYFSPIVCKFLNGVSLSKIAEENHYSRNSIKKLIEQDLIRFILMETNMPVNVVQQFN